MNEVKNELSRIEAKPVRSDFEQSIIGEIVEWSLLYTKKQFVDNKDMIATYWKEVHGIET